MPVIKRTLNPKFPNASGTDAPQNEKEERDELVSASLARVLCILQALRLVPNAKPIGKLEIYIAAIARRQFADFLKKKYPNRSKLENEVKLVLADYPFAKWTITHHGRTFAWCGMASQQQASSEAGIDQRNQKVEIDPHAWAFQHLPGMDVAQIDLYTLLAEMFRYLGSPIRFNTLISILCKLRNVHDYPVDSLNYDDYLDAQDRPENLGARNNLKRCLERLWDGVKTIKRQVQRSCLLLGLDEITLLPELGIASMTDIAGLLEMSLSDLNDLWYDLPLDDAKIGAMLGIETSAVSRRRRTAREFLARRMEQSDPED